VDNWPTWSIWISVKCISFNKLPLAFSVHSQCYGIKSYEKNTMLRIQRSGNGEVVFTLSGRMDEDDIAELETLIRLEPDRHRIVLDLRDLTLAGQDAVSFFERWETEGITLKNCAAYVREWITRSRDRS
jgi:hypothetical protein